MLTEREKAWIEQREAMQFLTGTYIADFEEYPLWNPGKDWREAAEFESRVAAKLADWLARDMGCFVCGEKICTRHKDQSCSEKLLKAARLAVEEEMDVDAR